jgi:hypothetical protein
MNARGSAISVDGLAAMFTMSFILVIVLNVCALFYGFVSLGSFRATILDARGQGSRWSKFVSFSLRPGVITFVHGVIWYSFLAQLFLSNMYLVMFVLLEAISSLCGTSEAEAALSLKGMNKFMTSVGVGKMDIKFIADFCSEGDDVLQAALLVFLGCLVTVISQSVMAAALSPEKVVAACGDSEDDNFLRAPSSASLPSMAASLAPSQGNRKSVKRAMSHISLGTQATRETQRNSPAEITLNVGAIQAGDRVQAKFEFRTDDKEQITIPKGVCGTVYKVKPNGTALIEFENVPDRYCDVWPENFSNLQAEANNPSPANDVWSLPSASDLWSRFT